MKERGFIEADEGINPEIDSKGGIIETGIINASRILKFLKLRKSLIFTMPFTHGEGS